MSRAKSIGTARAIALAASLLAAPGGLASAQPASPPAAPSEQTDAFDRSYATSFYIFDACGDGLAGRIYRQALVERFNLCPFSPAARQRFRQRSAAQRARSGQMIEAMIEDNGGLPVRLAGMSMTCHEQQATSDYQQMRARLEQYSSGALQAPAIVPAPCNADTITP